MKHATEEAYDLFHRTSIALAEVEANGIKIDTDYLDKAIRRTERQIAKIKEEMLVSEFYKKWERRYGDELKLNSDAQLVDVLQQDFGHEWKDEDRTEKGAAKADAATLSKIDIPFLKDLLKFRDLDNLKTTFLEGIKRETVDGFIHPMFPLNTAASYRGSSNRINFQNQPNHDESQRKLIRRAFVFRDYGVEVDFGTHELKIAACVWKDKNMIAYASDPDKDIHRDWAMELFKSKREDISKPMRQCSKNKFVFPILYGDYYINCANCIWEDCDALDIKNMAGEPIKNVLRLDGIKKLGLMDPKVKPRPGTYENHVKKCQEKFLGKFPDFDKGKEREWELYQKRGWFELITGFVCRGIYKKNKVLNYKVQGPAFHCLTWALIEIMAELKKRKMKTLIVGEIHDCILADCPKNEVQDFINICEEIMTRRLLKAWKWIVVPLSIEVDVIVPGESWNDKKQFTKQGGIWKLKE